MICLRCDNEEFLLKQDALVEQEFRGETFQVHTPAIACTKCGWTTVDLQQADELRKRTADAYRKKHALLTSDEIKALRKLLGMNQRDFAAFLGVGDASIKRWETWLPQEKANDELIRLKCSSSVRTTLSQSLTTTWISLDYPTHPQLMKLAGIRTLTPNQKTSEPTLPPSRWKLPEQPNDSADQDELKLEDLDESTAATIPCAA